MAEYLINGETLAAIANNIREFSQIGDTPLTPVQMADGVEAVYDCGYDNGYEEGSASASPVLYGTYMLKSSVEFAPAPSSQRLVFGGEAYTYFYNGNEYVYDAIDYIEFGEYGDVYIYCTNLDSKYWNGSDTSWGAWVQYEGEEYSLPGETYRIIDIRAPIAVEQIYYDWFMEIVDCNSDYTPYEVGMQNSNLITFSIDSRTYYAVERMTWNQWCHSKGNTNKFVEISGYIYEDNSLSYYVGNAGGSWIDSSDILIDGENYFTYSNE